MSVVPFSRARFTPADVAAFTEIALPRLADGRWTSISRCSGAWGDRLAVMLPGRSAPAFTLERGHSGAYALYFHDRSQDVLIGRGDSAAECLRVWTRAPRGRTRSCGAA